jgi:hypothetical protein
MHQFLDDGHHLTKVKRAKKIALGYNKTKTSPQPLSSPLDTKNSKSRQS